MTAALDLFRFANLSSVAGVEHAISTRHGGVSEGLFATLNVSFSVGDETGNVEENLRRVAEAAGGNRERLFWPRQVHGKDVAVIEPDAMPGPSRPECDALATASQGQTLLLRFADCTPILLADPARRVVAGAHAGWRGTALRTAAAAVQAMVEAFGTNPRDVLAGIGPAIGPCCYEVGEEVAEAFGDRPWALVRQNGARPRLDLWEANRRALVEAGVPEDQVEVASICTRCHADRFFSHRAAGGQPAGRFAALIRLA